MQGFLAFPLCLPGTAVWRGRRGRLYILSVLERAAGRSKAAMKVRRGRAPVSVALRHASNRFACHPRPASLCCLSPPECRQPDSVTRGIVT